MSRAFDTVDRAKLIEVLHSIPNVFDDDVPRLLLLPPWTFYNKFDSCFASRHSPSRSF